MYYGAIYLGREKKREHHMKNTRLLVSIIAIAIGVAAVAVLSGCSAPASPLPEVEVSATASASSEAPDPDASAPDTDTDNASGISVGPTVLPDGVEIACSNLDVSDLAPWGQKTAQTTDTVNVTTFSSCTANIDSNGDGNSTAVDAVSDSGHITGGLLEKLDGGQVDPSSLDDYDVWALCIDGERADTEVAEGWDYASACVDEHGGITDITYLLVGTTQSSKPATLTCSVHAGAFGFNGREADIERFCSQVLLAANGGTYGD